MAQDTSLESILTSLQVPSDFVRLESIQEDQPSTQDELNQWKEQTYDTLLKLQSDTEGRLSGLNLRVQADIVTALAAFDGTEDPWITSDSREAAQVILDKFKQVDNDSEKNTPLLRQLLVGNIKPWFQSNPHPYIHVDTGRKLGRAAGGPLASGDYYEAQTWKKYPGAANVVSWCVRNMKAEVYEELWHLIIPAVMALLDDYEARNKLRGVKIVAELLVYVPKGLLKRTGIDGLLHTSLNTCLAHLNNPESADLIRATVPTHISLIELTTAPGSKERFDKLSHLLGEGIIGGVWFYASEDRDTVMASLESLLLVVEAIGIGSTRFLKGLMTKLVHLLMPNPLNPTPGSEDLQIAALRVLIKLIDKCASRMQYWSGPIIDGVCRCWVSRRKLDDVGERTGPSPKYSRG
ncbi:hypothetical protein BDN72DRAFT_833295 [Pluteus cervinus]|uniref:Uncharacterized protein n=1 Tax=Pluteus cervinus TaxID=181527 RepID=A0ACD3B9K6_9AGAR|nr:hypothetical protein BDN72DRAFT_833295 [Pluteus cervinus]